MSPNNPSTEKSSYWVALWTGLHADGIDAYEYSCFDHWQALALAISDHKAAGRPFSSVTRFLVEGPCRDRGCDCGGKSRAKAGLVSGEAADKGWMN